LREDVKELDVTWNHASCLVLARKLRQPEMTTSVHVRNGTSKHSRNTAINIVLVNIWKKRGNITQTSDMHSFLTRLVQVRQQTTKTTAHIIYIIHVSAVIYTVSPKKEATKLWAVTLSNLNRF